MTDTLIAGRELDALVAEKVMGWHRVSRSQAYGFPEKGDLWCSADGTPQRSEGTFPGHGDFTPSTDIAAAWEVVEKLIEGGRQVEVNGYNDEGDPDVNPWVVLVDLTVSSAQTAPLAICLAALKAVA